MSLLDTASLLLTPNAYKEGKLYSVIPSDGSGDMSVTRATTATRVNSAGLVELVPYNLLTWSQDFSNVIWVKNEATISSNITTAPNGTTTASKLIENTANDSHHIYQNATTSGVNTFSFYAKKGERTFVYAYADSVGQGKCFNLTSGTLGVNIISAPINATIESVGNDWFRCTITVSITSASALRIGLCSADGTFSYLGNGTSGAYICGGQLVEGTLPKDYQKTETRLNIPRLDYSNGTCPSLLVEPQRTNLALYSNALSTGTNVVDASTITANFYVSPDGTQNAMQFTETTDNSRHGFYQYTTVTAQTYTASIFTKQTGRRYIALRSDITGTATSSFFDLQTISVLSSGSGHTCSIQDFGNGWLRLVVTFTASAGSRYLVWCGSPDGINVVYAGSTSISQTFYGYQLEAGSYPTSYIPTTSASVTKNRDLGPNDVFASTFNLNADFCLFQDFECFDFSNFPVFWSGGNYAISGDYRSYMISYGTTNMSLFGVNEVLTAQINSFTFATNTRYKVAVRRVGSTINWFINGVKYSNGTGTTTTTVKIRSISGASLGGQNTMLLKEAAIWESELTDAECIQLTTI